MRLFNDTGGARLEADLTRVIESVLTSVSADEAFKPDKT